MGTFEEIMAKKNEASKVPQFIHSGSYALDYIVSGRADGSGGWPIGRVIELHGEPYSGKSLWGIKAAAEFQKMFGDEALIFYDDVEEGVDPTFATKHGMDLDGRVIVTSLHPEAAAEFTSLVMTPWRTANKDAKIPESLVKSGFSSSSIIEECFQRVRAIVSFKDFRNLKILIIVDSIAALSCAYEVAYQGNRVDQGQRAKALKQSMRLTPTDMALHDATLIFTNHDITGPQQAKASSGGSAPKYHPGVRVTFSKPAPIRENKESPVIGVQLTATCDKTRYTYPFGEVVIKMLWDRGIDPYEGLPELLVENEVINKSGAWWKIPGDEKGYRSEDIINMLKEGKLDIPRRI